MASEKLIENIKNFPLIILGNKSDLAENRRAVNTSTVEITELPVNRWTEDQKMLLMKLVAAKSISSFREHHTEEKVSFRVTLKRNQLKVLNDEEKLLRLFKLVTPIHTSNISFN